MARRASSASPDPTARRSPDAPAGIVRIDHEDPFQRCAIGEESAVPTAIHAVAVGHATAASRFSVIRKTIRAAIKALGF